jgi:hypothetical protein
MLYQEADCTGWIGERYGNRTGMAGMLFSGVNSCSMRAAAESADYDEDDMQS